MRSSSAASLRGVVTIIIVAVISNTVSGRRIVIEVPYHIKAMTHTHTVYKLLPDKSLPLPPSAPAPSVIAATVAAPDPQAYPAIAHVPPSGVMFPEHRARLSFATRGVRPGHNEHLHVNLQGSLHHTEARM